MAKKKITEETKTTASPAATTFETKERDLWILTALCFAGFYFYSTKSLGFHQDDELAHFISMKSFWDDPTTIMGNWSKPGYKLLYALPVLLGYNFVLILNCAISALGCWLAAKTAQYFNKNAAIPALLMAALSPIWVEMSFRNYADILSGVLLIASIYLALREKCLFSALLLSYDVLVRQEFLIIVLIFGLYLLIKKKFIPAFSLGLFPFLYALWTMSAKGDFFYMITEAQSTSAAYAKEYPRQGLFHYVSMAAVCFGALQIPLLAAGTYQNIKNAFNKAWLRSPESKMLLVFIPFIVFFGIHSLFNMKSPEIGPATGGNLRYMTAIGPLVGAIAAIALATIKQLKITEVIGVVVVSGIAVVAAMMHAHNYGVNFEVDKNGEAVKDSLPFFIFAAGALLLVLPIKGWMQIGYIAVFGLGFLAKELHPYKLSAENESVQKCVKKIVQDANLEKRMVISNNPGVWFFWLKENNELKKNSGTLDSATIKSAPVGALCVWDSHYGYKPNRTPGSVMPKYFENDTFKYLEPLGVMSKDQRFQIVVFEKVK